jgi:GT2 family glycosyltransferase
MKISVIIATCKFKLIKQCVDSILESTDLEGKYDIEFIVAMNGCEIEAIDYIRSLGKRFRFIWFDQRMGAVTVFNLAAKIANSDYLVKMDDDVIILNWRTDLWLDLLLAPFLNNDKVGQTGPLLQQSYGGCLSLIGCISMTTKKIWDEVGGLDPIFNPGLGDDIDYSVKVAKHGYKIIQTPENGFWNMPGTICTYPFCHISVRDYQTDPTELSRKNALVLFERYGFPWENALPPGMSTEFWKEVKNKSLMVANIATTDC